MPSDSLHLGLLSMESILASLGEPKLTRGIV